MKKKNRNLSVLLIFICLLLGACAAEKGGDDQGTDTKSNFPPDSAGDPGASAEVPELFPIVENGKTEFSVVHNLNDPTQIELVRSFISGIQKETGRSLPLNSQGSAERPCEILIGNVTTRTQSREAIADTPYTAGSVRMIGTKLVISAYRTEELKKVLEHLSSALIYTSGGNCALPKDYSYEYNTLLRDLCIPQSGSAQRIPRQIRQLENIHRIIH